jgi:hypothetical protein
MDVTIEIKSGIFDLIASGTFITYPSDFVSLTLKSNEEPLIFIFKFENSETDKDKVKKALRQIDSNTLELTFTNYNNSVGNYTKKPWAIGTLFKRRLYIAYLISGISGVDYKKVEYSFYLGEEVANG